MTKHKSRRSSALSDLTVPQLMCHMGRHLFSEPAVYLVKMKDNISAWVMIYECGSCGTTREDYCEPETFELWYRTYDYSNAPGYLLTFRPSIEEIRSSIANKLSGKNLSVKR